MPKFTVVSDAFLFSEIEADSPDEAQSKWRQIRGVQSEWDVDSIGRVMLVAPDRVFVLTADGMPTPRYTRKKMGEDA
jgi:hypothetical protein